jgi:hypothetical protein
MQAALMDDAGTSAIIQSGYLDVALAVVGPLVHHFGSIHGARSRKGDCA